MPAAPTLFEELEARIRRLELLVLMYPVPLDAASGWITGDGGTLDDDGVARIQDLLVELRQEVFGAG